MTLLGSRSRAAALLCAFAMPMATLVYAPSAAAAKKPMRNVSISMSHKGEYYVYSSASTKSVTYKATLSYGAKGKHARLQRLSPTYRGTMPRGSAWQTVKAVKLKKNGRQSVSFGSTKVPRGRWTYRVTSDATKKYRGGTTSMPSAVHLVSCTSPNAPGKVYQTFSNPAAQSEKNRSKRTITLASAWQNYICAAGNGAKINIAIWALNDDALFKSRPNVSNRILGALDYVQKRRGVKIRLIQDDVNGTATLPQTEDWLRQMTGGKMSSNGRVAKGTDARRGGYYRCKNSCMSDRARSGVESGVAPGYMHAKFMTIDKTITSWTGQNAVAVSTGNWSFWQLRDYWNSFTAFRDKPILAKRLDSRFDAMVASALDKVSTRFDPTWTATPGTDAEDRLEVPPQDWYAYPVWTAVDGHGEKSGGDNVSVAFSPNRPGEDTILDRLDDYTCTPEHHTIRVGMYFASGAVGKRFGDILNALKTKGCSVNYVMSLPVNPTSPARVRSDKGSLDNLQTGLGADKVRCTALMHSKNILVDAIGSDGTSPEKSVWTAARNMDVTGLVYDDEVSVRITDLKPTYDAFLADWTRIWNSGKTCTDKMMGY